MIDSDKKSTLTEWEQRKGESLRRHLVRGVLGTGGLGILQSGLSLLTAIVLARVLGADGYGYYAFAIAAISAIAIPTQLGMPTLLTREVAACHTRGDWSLMRGMRRRAIQLAIIGVALSIVIICVGLLFGTMEIAALDRITFALALLLLPLWVATAVESSLLSGLRLVIHASWPRSVLQPLMFLLILLILVGWTQPLTPSLAVGANIAATASAFLAAALVLRKHWPVEATAAEPAYRTKRWLKSLIPFTMMAGINIINQKTDVLMLGVMTSAEDVGVYNIALQGGMLVSFSLTAFNAVLVPNIARLHAQGAREQLQRLLTQSTAAMSIVAVITGIILFVGGQWLLERVFGETYVQAYPALCVLMLGQLINAAMGSVGYFLSMTGHEKDTTRAIATSAIVNFTLNILLIPIFGILGAAIATATSVVVWNIILGIQLYRRLGLIPGPLPFQFDTQSKTTESQ